MPVSLCFSPQMAQATTIGSSSFSAMLSSLKTTLPEGMSRATVAETRPWLIGPLRSYRMHRSKCESCSPVIHHTNSVPRSRNVAHQQRSERSSRLSRMWWCAFRVLLSCLNSRHIFQLGTLAPSFCKFLTIASAGPAIQLASVGVEGHGNPKNSRQVVGPSSLFAATGRPRRSNICFEGGRTFIGIGGCHYQEVVQVVDDILHSLLPGHPFYSAVNILGADLRQCE